MIETRVAAQYRRRALIERLVSAGWVAFGMLLVGAFGAALVSLNSGHAYDEEGYPTGDHDSSAAENLALFLFLTRVLPWVLATSACGLLLRGRFRSIGLLALSIPAWAWDALIAYRFATWPKIREDWPYDLVFIAPAFVVTAIAWASWPKAAVSAERAD